MQRDVKMISTSVKTITFKREGTPLIFNFTIRKFTCATILFFTLSTDSFSPTDTLYHSKVVPLNLGNRDSLNQDANTVSHMGMYMGVNQI